MYPLMQGEHFFRLYGKPLRFRQVTSHVHADRDQPYWDRPRNGHMVYEMVVPDGVPMAHNCCNRALVERNRHEYRIPHIR